MKTFNVYKTLTIQVVTCVEADTKEEAEEQAEENIGIMFDEIDCDFASVDAITHAATTGVDVYESNPQSDSDRLGFDNGSE